MTRYSSLITIAHNDVGIVYRKPEINDRLLNMNTAIEMQQAISTLNQKAKLSTAWIFVFLNVIFRDIHELLRSGLLEEMLSDVVNGVPMTQETLLIAGIMLEISSMMVLLSRILTYRINRWANIIIGVLTIVSILVVGNIGDMDDVFFATVEVIALLYIIVSAWQWKPNTITKFSLSEGANEVVGLLLRFRQPQQPSVCYRAIPYRA